MLVYYCKWGRILPGCIMVALMLVVMLCPVGPETILIDAMAHAHDDLGIMKNNEIVVQSGQCFSWTMYHTGKREFCQWRRWLQMIGRIPETISRAASQLYRSLYDNKLYQIHQGACHGKPKMWAKCRSFVAFWLFDKWAISSDVKCKQLTYI